MRMDLRPRLLMTLECTVCRQMMRDRHEAATAVQLFGAKAYAVCPCCNQEVDHETEHDRNYRARVRRFVKRKGGTHE